MKTFKIALKTSLVCFLIYLLPAEFGSIGDQYFNQYTAFSDSIMAAFSSVPKQTKLWPKNDDLTKNEDIIKWGKKHFGLSLKQLNEEHAKLEALFNNQKDSKSRLLSSKELKEIRNPGARILSKTIQSSGSQPLATQRGQPTSHSVNLNLSKLSVSFTTQQNNAKIIKKFSSLFIDLPDSEDIFLANYFVENVLCQSFSPEKPFKKSCIPLCTFKFILKKLEDNPQKKLCFKNIKNIVDLLIQENEVQKAISKIFFLIEDSQVRDCKIKISLGNNNLDCMGQALGSIIALICGGYSYVFTKNTIPLHIKGKTYTLKEMINQDMTNKKKDIPEGNLPAKLIISKEMTYDEYFETLSKKSR